MSERYIELKKENLIFKGKTEKEKKINETIFDLCIENDALYEENKELKLILTEFEKWLEEKKEKTFNAFPTYDLEKQDFVNNEIHYAPAEKTYKEVLDKLQELKNKKID